MKPMQRLSVAVYLFAIAAFLVLTADAQLDTPHGILATAILAAGAVVTFLSTKHASSIVALQRFIAVSTGCIVGLTMAISPFTEVSQVWHNAKVLSQSGWVFVRVVDWTPTLTLAGAELCVGAAAVVLLGFLKRKR